MSSDLRYSSSMRSASSGTSGGSQRTGLMTARLAGYWLAGSAGSGLATRERAPAAGVPDCARSALCNAAHRPALRLAEDRVALNRRDAPLCRPT
ncbi:unnamed protein product [Danaus chrysippus]|uniref:(African queen) hypothetical protein n=1 Tax=Danaus chrysippus TaxID=151541 RepID=A0A8J2QF61_9NEOP|nr:unnamed protein product [Danaus chrysippus]